MIRRALPLSILVAVQLAHLLVARLGLADEREFSFQRGPIRRELARIAAPAEGEREQEFREQRLHRYAWAIADAAEAHPGPAGRRAMVAALLAVGEHESHFAEGVCETFDGSRPAVGCWQWERSRKEPAPRNVEEAARLAARDLARHWRRETGFGCAVTRYATGRAACDPAWSGTHKRVKSYTRILGRI